MVCGLDVAHELVTNVFYHHRTAAAKCSFTSHDREPQYKKRELQNSKACDFTNQINGSERSSAWLEHLLWEQDVAGSNPVAPTTFHLLTLRATE